MFGLRSGVGSENLIDERSRSPRLSVDIPFCRTPKTSERGASRMIRPSRWSPTATGSTVPPRSTSSIYAGSDHCHGFPLGPVCGNCGNQGQIPLKRIDAFAGNMKPFTSLCPARRLESLKFLVHFVGDLHQPFHFADDHDREASIVARRMFALGALAEREI